MSYVETMKSPGVNWRAAYELASLIKNDPKLAKDSRLLGELARLLDQDPPGSRPTSTLLKFAASLSAFQDTRRGERVGGEGRRDRGARQRSTPRTRTGSAPRPRRARRPRRPARRHARRPPRRGGPGRDEDLGRRRPADLRRLRSDSSAAPSRPPPSSADARRHRPRRPLGERRRRSRPRRGDPGAAVNVREMLSDKDLNTLLTSLPRLRAAQPDRVHRACGRSSRSKPPSPPVGSNCPGPSDPKSRAALSRSGLVTVRSRGAGALENFTSRAVKNRGPDRIS